MASIVSTHIIKNMELFGGLLFLACAPIISAIYTSLGVSHTFKAPKSANYVVPNMNKTGQYFLSGSLVNKNGNAFSYFREHCKCKVTESSPYGRVIVYCSSASSETPANIFDCPINKVLTEALIVNGSPFPTKINYPSTSSATSPVPETDRNTPINPQVNLIKIECNDAETQSSLQYIVDPNLVFLFVIIECQLVILVIAVLFVCFVPEHNNTRPRQSAAPRGGQ